MGNRFLEMKGGREALRNAYIKSGVLPDPDKPTDLALAVKLVGTCQDMCPEFEREEREFQKELDPLEVYPGTDRVDPRIAVKIYRRPAAGRELPLPEDVRPPPVLKRTWTTSFTTSFRRIPTTQDSRLSRASFGIETERCGRTLSCKAKAVPLLSNATSASQDTTSSVCTGEEVPAQKDGGEQQELEQLRKTMRSLIEFYDDNRRKSATSAGAVVQPSPNEAEFAHTISCSTFEIPRRCAKPSSYLATSSALPLCKLR